MHREDQPRAASVGNQREPAFANLVRSIEELLVYSGVFGDGQGRSRDLFKLHALRLALLLGWSVSRGYIAYHIRTVGQNLGLDIPPPKAEAFALQLELVYKDCMPGADGRS